MAGATWGCGKIGHGYSDKKLFDAYAVSGPGPNRPMAAAKLLSPEVPYLDATDWGPLPDRDETTTDHQVADWAVDRLSRKSDKPFFLGVGFICPHVPLCPAKMARFVSSRKSSQLSVLMDDLSDAPETSRRMHELLKYPTRFLAQEQGTSNSAMRAPLTWPALPLSIIRSAASWMPWIKARMPRTLRSFFLAIMGITSGKRTGVSKHSLWEESTRVPLVVVPAKSQAYDFGKKGATCSKPVGLIDLYPTMRDVRLAGERKNEGMSRSPCSTHRKSGGLPFYDYARQNHALRSERLVPSGWRMGRRNSTITDRSQRVDQPCRQKEVR